MSQLSFREARQSDAPAILDLYQEAILEMEKHGIFQWDEHYPANMDSIENDIRDNEMMVAEKDDQIAAVYVLNDEYDEAYKQGHWQAPHLAFLVIHRLCVHPQFQHSGIGTVIMQYIEQTCQQRRVGAIRLDVYSKNPLAIRMYDKLGFAKVGEATWSKGNFLLMEKILTAQDPFANR